MQENDFVHWLRNYAQPPVPQITVGIGDDAALLRLDRPAVVTSDLLCDGTHFERASCTAEQIGRKAMAVNLSDIAAMAAHPVAAFVSLLLPGDATETFCQQLMEAAMQLAHGFDCQLAGGDTNTCSDRLAISVTIVGEATERGPLLRSGAEPGDVLLVTGSLGGSLAGHHFEFTPRIREALLLHERYRLHAGLDLSDGLAMDARRLATASNVGIDLDASNIPISPAARTMSDNEDEALLRALGDGEDFELLLAVPPAEAQKMLAEQPLSVPLTAVGSCFAGDGRWLVQDGNRQELPRVGYEHGQR